MAQTLYWDATAANLASSGPTIQLRDRDGKIAGTIPSSRLKKLVSAKERIAEATAMQDVRLLVSNESKPNAFAGAKDGRRAIAFTIGMLNVLGEDEDLMAAVMGHEFGHLAKNHQGRGGRQAAAEVVSFLAGLIAGRTIANPLAAEVASQAGNLGGRALIFSYDRDQEREADSFGIEAMARAGYDPYAAARYWQLMANESGGGIFTTHPSGSERLENVRRIASLQTKKQMQTASIPMPVREVEPRQRAGEVAAETVKPGALLERSTLSQHVYRPVQHLSLLQARQLVIDLPTDAQSWLVLARAYAEQKQFVDAARALGEAERMKSAPLGVIYESGRIAFLEGRSEEVGAKYLQLSERDSQLALEYFDEFLLPKLSQRSGVP